MHVYLLSVSICALHRDTYCVVPLGPSFHYVHSVWLSFLITIFHFIYISRYFVDLRCEYGRTTVGLMVMFFLTQPYLSTYNVGNQVALKMVLRNQSETSVLCTMSARISDVPSHWSYETASILMELYKTKVTEYLE